MKTNTPTREKHTHRKKFVSCAPPRRSVRPPALNATSYFVCLVAVTLSRLSHGIRLVSGGLVTFSYPKVIFVKRLLLRLGISLDCFMEITRLLYQAMRRRIASIPPRTPMGMIGTPCRRHWFWLHIGFVTLAQKGGAREIEVSTKAGHQ